MLVHLSEYNPMQKKLIGLAVATLLTPLASANEASWLELDKDISSLATMTAVEGAGASVSGYIQNSYVSDSDTNLGGWDFGAIRLNFKAHVEDVAVKVSFDMKTGTAVLKDAYARWDATEGMTVTWGMFKRPFLHSFLTSSNKRLFVDSTANAANEARDNGVMLNGDITDMGTWQIAATNGADGATDDNYYTARVAFTALGEGGFNEFEGARGDADGTNLSVGVSYAEDNAAGFEHDKLGIEIAGNVDAISYHVDMVMYSDDATAPADATLGTATADTSPLGITVSYMLDDNMEVALRHEDFDDTSDSSRLSIGFNLYTVLPNHLVWQFGYSDVSSDSAPLETELISVGLLASF